MTLKMECKATVLLILVIDTLVTSIPAQLSTEIPKTSNISGYWGTNISASEVSTPPDDLLARPTTELPAEPLAVTKDESSTSIDIERRENITSLSFPFNVENIPIVQEDDSFIYEVPSLPVGTPSLSEGSEDPVKECLEILVSGSSHRSLKCPDVQAFHLFLKQESFKHESVEMQIENVDGVLPLPSSASVKLVSLIVRNANLTKIIIPSTQPRMLRTLKKLDLSGNPGLNATSLMELGPILSLTNLTLRGSALTSLESQLPGLLQHFVSLKYLDVSRAGIRHLHSYMFAPNELEHLDLAGNEIRWIILSEGLLNHLRYLNMSGCSLRHIQVFKASVIETTPLVEYRNKPRNLRVLDVSNNLLSDLPALLLRALVPESIILSLTNNLWHEGCEKCSMYFLWDYLTHQPLETMMISHLQARKEVECFNKTAALRNCDWEMCPQGCRCDEKKQIVDCSAIGLESVPEVAPSNAITLLLQNNKLRSLAGIESPVWCSLRTLNADGNLMTKLLPTGTRGNCSCHTEENYYSTERSCFPQNLEKLFVNKNLLQNLTANDCPLLYSLQELKLSMNQVNAAGTQQCGPLEYLKVLDLSYNNISIVYNSDFASYPLLNELYLSHNALKLVQSCVISFMHKLRVFDLSHNDVDTVVGNLSAPHTIFYTKEASNIETLLLHNNRLPHVAYVLSLMEIPSLQNVTLNNNPWSCSCSDLKPLKNVVLGNNFPALNRAKEDMYCATPSRKANKRVNEMLKEECFDSSKRANSEISMTIMAVVIFVGFTLLIMRSKYWKRAKESCKLRRRRSEERTTSRREYDCFVVSSSKDHDLLRDMVIIPLTQRGYKIAWHDNAFRPGEWIMANVERAVRNSSRMLVFATENLTTSRWTKQEIKRGLHEEFAHSDFKIMALVSPTLPRQLNRDLYELVTLRTHVQLSDRDYIEQICNFLPTPAPVQNRSEGINMSMSDIEALLNRIRDMRNREGGQNIPLGEIYHTCPGLNRVTVNVDIATAPSSQAHDSTSLPTLSKEERSEIIQRFKANHSASSKQEPDTSSLKYELREQEQDDDICEIMQEENFVRCTYTRISCKF